MALHRGPYRRAQPNDLTRMLFSWTPTPFSNSRLMTHGVKGLAGGSQSRGLSCFYPSRNRQASLALCRIQRCMEDTTAQACAESFTTRRRPWVQNLGPSITSCDPCTPSQGKKSCLGIGQPMRLAPLFGVAVQAGGFNGRPVFPCENKVRELLDAYFTKQSGRAHTCFILRQPRISPTVEQEDLTLPPATIRANYMPYIKSRSKQRTQVQRRV